MTTINTLPLSGEQVAKLVLFLAYQASGARGLGVLHDVPNGTLEEDHLWRGQEGDEIHADYVAGRMVKLWGFQFDASSITFDDKQTPRADYQSWCGTYPTNAALVEAAIASLREIAKETP